MILRTLLILVLFASFISPLPANGQECAEDAYKKAFEKLKACETAEESVAVFKEFVLGYPDHKYARVMLTNAVNFYCWNLRNLKGAVELVKEVLQKTTNPENIRSAKIRLIELYGKLKNAAELETIVQDLGDVTTLDYMTHKAIVEAAVESELWETALKHAEAALPMSTRECVRAEMEARGIEVTDDDLEQIDRYSKRRMGPTLAAKGWSLANLGRIKEALTVFECAVDKTIYFYIGAPNTRLHIYWARTLMKLGNYGGAMRRIAPDAVFLGGPEHMEVFKEAYIARHGDDSGLEEYIWNKRLELAPTVCDFSLADYNGASHKFSEMKGKVTILTFWFPT